MANIMTAEGLKQLQEKLDYLVGTRRNEIAKQIEIARGFGDLSENAEYEEARKDQARMEEEILRLQNLIRTAEVVSADAISTEKVSVGTKVTINDLSKNRELVYAIVGSEEADPWKKMISTDSAVGMALIGHKVGDQVTVELPKGSVVYEITSIARRD